MTETDTHPTPAMLQRLSTLREMPAVELEAIAGQLFLHECRKGDVLLEIGATDNSTLYLIEGSVRQIAEDGAVKTVRHTDTSALAPLARLRPSHYKLIAESRVRYLLIDNELYEQAVGKLEESSSLTLESYQVEEEDDLGPMDAEN
jgi:signal-transduction protein with cAMP-binding, CBS, and nucleotidyltransferase domain